MFPRLTEVTQNSTVKYHYTIFTSNQEVFARGDGDNAYSLHGDFINSEHHAVLSNSEHDFVPPPIIV